MTEPRRAAARAAPYGAMMPDAVGWVVLGFGVGLLLAPTLVWVWWRPRLSPGMALALLWPEYVSGILLIAWAWWELGG